MPHRARAPRRVSPRGSGARAPTRPPYGEPGEKANRATQRSYQANLRIVTSHTLEALGLGPGTVACTFGA